MSEFTQLKEKFKQFIGKNKVYVDTFILERKPANIYCLFFFTTHIRGFEKMLEVKWAMDEFQGEGFKLENSPTLFSAVELKGYDDKLINFISTKEDCTNIDIYKFGLENGFLPKHSNQVLKKLKNEGKLETLSLDNKIVKGNYIAFNSDRRVKFRIININY